MLSLDNEVLRQGISELLAAGRAVSTSELRTRLRAPDDTELTDTALYRQLAVLAGRGAITRVGRCGRHSYWAQPDSAPLAKSLLHGRGSSMSDHFSRRGTPDGQRD